MMKFVSHKRSTGVNYCLLTLMVLLLWASVTGCQTIESTTVLTPPPTKVFTEELLHYRVVSAEGRVIGSVDGFVVGTASAGVDYVVIRIKDIYNFGKGGGGPQDRFLIIPWSHLATDVEHRRLIIDRRAAVLAEAPTTFELPNTATPAWDADIEAFWAQQ